MSRKRLQFRVHTDEAELLEEHADDADISKSEALRRSMRLYLVRQGYDVPATDGGVTSTTTDEIQRTVRVSNVVLAVAILWLGAVVAFDPPGLFTILTGSALAGVLVLVLATGVRQ